MEMSEFGVTVGSRSLPRPRECFQRDNMYDTKPQVQSDVVRQRINNTQSNEHRQRPERQSSAVKAKRCNLERQDARLGCAQYLRRGPLRRHEPSAPA